MTDRQTVTGSIVIEAPAEFVWEVLNDPQSYVEGIDWVYEAWVEGEGSMQKGSVYVERAKPGLREGEYRWEVTEFDPPRRAVHSHSSGELEADIEITVEPLGGTRTKYSQEMRFRGLPAFRPLGLILERTFMKRQMSRDFQKMILPNYKRIVEEQFREMHGKA